MNARAKDAGSWFDDVRAKGVAMVAQSFGVELVRRGHDLSFPCPACGKVRRHTKGSDRRAAAKVVREGSGWWCEPCGETGSAVDLAALIVTGKAKPGGDGWRDTRRECAAAGLCDPDPGDTRPPPAPRRPTVMLPVDAPPPRGRTPADELTALWAAGIKPWEAPLTGRPGDASAAAYIASRGINLGDLALFEPDLCRILPAPGTYPFPAWWLRKWTQLWRWAVLAYEPDGTPASIQARRIDGSNDEKTHWPFGPNSRGLLFANARGLALLRGVPGDTEAVLVTEGLSDTVIASTFYPVEGRRFAVLGVVQGGAQAFATVRWPEGLECRVATDPDKDGEKYAREVRAALPRSVVVKRILFGEGPA